jgi:hypothetical protein
MGSISIRGVDDQLSLLLKEKATETNKSVNQLVLDILKSTVGLQKKRYTRQYNDLDHLFGKWSQDEFDAVQGKIDAERRIDDELWK